MVKNLIFDLGNVLYNIDVQSTQEKLAALTGLDIESDQGLKEIFIKFETGKINYVVFVNYLLKVSKNRVVANHIIHAWNHMLLGVNPMVTDWLINFKNQGNFNFYILSNINELHAERFEHDLDKLIIKDLWQKEIFNKIYYSHIIGFRKPDSNAFEFVLKDSKLNRKETIFIDDLGANIDAAESLGIKGILFDRRFNNYQALSDQIIKISNAMNN